MFNIYLSYLIAALAAFFLSAPGSGATLNAFIAVTWRNWNHETHCGVSLFRRRAAGGAPTVATAQVTRRTDSSSVIETSQQLNTIAAICTSVSVSHWAGVSVSLVCATWHSWFHLWCQLARRELPLFITLASFICLCFIYFILLKQQRQTWLTEAAQSSPH